eukprot:403369430
MDRQQIEQKKLTQRVHTEIELHSKLKKNCPNLIELYTHFMDDENIYLLLEYCEGMELYAKLKQQKNEIGFGFEEQKVAQYFWKICLGMKYLHDQGILHRDMKLSNILINPKEDIKIIDLGLAIRIQDLKTEQIAGCGTPNYIAPEVIMSKSYGLKADIWSLGCIFFALLTGTPPFEEVNVQETIQRAKAGKYSIPSKISSQAADLIKKMLVKKQNDRIAINGILEHEFFKVYEICQDLNENVEVEIQKYASTEIELMNQKFETINFERDPNKEQQDSAETPAFYQHMSSKNKQQSKINQLEKKGSCSKLLNYDNDPLEIETFDQRQKQYIQQKELPETYTTNLKSNLKAKYRNMSKIKQKIDEKINLISSKCSETMLQQESQLIQNQSMLQDKGKKSQQKQIQNDFDESQQKIIVQKQKVIQKENLPINQDPLFQVKKQIDHKQSEQDKYAKYKDILLQPLSTIRMTPIKHDNPKGTGYIKINRKGEVVQLLSKQMKKLYISPDGQKVSLKSLALKNKLTVDYRFEKLPSKLKPCESDCPDWQ